MTPGLLSPTAASVADAADREASASPYGAPSDHIRLSTSGDVLIVEPSGELDDQTSTALDRVLNEVSVPTVLDLRRCDAAGAAAFSGSDPGRWGRSPATVCVVLDRATAREVEGRPAPGMSVFHQTADAIQALVLAESGYGNGWS